MGFSTQSGFDDDEERRRREQAALAAQSQTAVSQTNDALSRAEQLAEKAKEGDEQQQQFNASLAQRKDEASANQANQAAALARQRDQDNTNYQLRMRETNANELRTNTEHFDKEATLRMQGDDKKRIASEADRKWAEYVKQQHLPVFIQGAMDKGVDDDVDIANMAKEHLGIDVDPLEVHGMRYGLSHKQEAADATADLTGARAEELRSRAGKEGRVGTGGGNSLKDKKTQAEIDRINAQTESIKSGKGANGKGGAAKEYTPQSMIDSADELAKIYEKNGDATGVAGPGARGPLADEDVIRAEQLGTTLSLGVPKSFSKNNRLNNTEFQESHKTVVGDVHALDTNAHKAARARKLADDLRKMKAEDEAAGGALPQQGGLDSKAKRDARIQELLRLSTE